MILHCSASVSFSANGAQYVYLLSVNSNCAGAGHAGVGGLIFFLIILVGCVICCLPIPPSLANRSSRFIVYFVGFALFNKFARQAEGLDVIPHREFWADTPFMAKDGIVFIKVRETLPLHIRSFRNSRDRTKLLVCVATRGTRRLNNYTYVCFSSQYTLQSLKSTHSRS